MASLNAGIEAPAVLSRANIAASSQVTRLRASTAIPMATEVDAAKNLA